MNTRSSPSRYRNCMSRRSTMAKPTPTPALNVRSTTPPVLRFRSFVRTKAPPLPGFTCWDSMTWKRLPSRRRVIPRLRSLVLTLMAAEALSQDHQLLGGPGQDPPARRRHLDHVLDANPAETLQVDAGL